MSARAVILWRERQMVSIFAARGAVGRAQARTLEELGVSRGPVFRRLRERAVIREAAPGQYYLDQASWAAVRKSRRRAVHVGLAIALALLLAILFGTRRARAAGEGGASWPDEPVSAQFTRPGSGLTPV